MQDAAPVLRADGLTLRYPGGVTALDQLTVEIPRGSVGLVGANGAGKTTLLRLALGLLRRPPAPSRSSAGPSPRTRWASAPASGSCPSTTASPSTRAPSDAVATLGELAGLPPRAARQRASEVLDLVGLDEARFRPIGGFSTGMRQRTKLAQALVADPELVLLDEPTAGLDPVGREEMLGLVARLSGFGISVVLATHLLDDVQRVCDSVVMIDGGRLLHAGPTEELLQRTGTVRVEVDDRADELVAAPRHRGRHGHGRRRRPPSTSRWTTRPRSTPSATPSTTWASRSSPSPAGATASTSCSPEAHQ